MSLSLAENIIVARADNRPPMLDKTNYRSWESRMLLYIKGKEHGKLLVDSVLNGPFQYGTMVEPGNETTPATIKARTYTDLADEEKIRESVDIKATNIFLHGSELSLQERESKLYDDFDAFTFMHGETIHSYYMRFAQLINDMHTIGMTMKPLQVNKKFVNHLQPEWSKFVTDVKLAKYMHTTNFDHLYAHIRQHEAHANEVRLARQRYPNQIALVANSLTCLNPTQYYPQLSSVTQQYYSPPAPQHSYDAPIQLSSIELDSGIVVPSFKPSNDLIANLNKLITFEPRNYLRWKSQRADISGETDTEEIPTLAAFQTDDLDAFDSNYDDAPPAKVVLMANLSSYDPDVLLELFEHGLHKELKEMKAIFNQMETEVAKCSVDKKYFEIEKKELSLDNDRLLEHIICQDVINVVMHVNVHNVLSVNTNCLDNDNIALESLKMENDHLMELLIS
ncbi:hypothetical protein Tco_0064281 [Tanacetum coccineum]